MKKTLIVMLVVITFTGIAYAQSIIVNSPDGSKTMFKGKICDIAWTSSGYVPAGVKINIFKESIAQSNFVLQLSGSDTGSMKWTIPVNFESGDYVLRIKTSDNKVTGDSPRFRISGQLSYQFAGKVYKPGTPTLQNTKTPVVTRTPPALPDMILSSIKIVRKVVGKNTTSERKVDYLRVQVKNNSKMDAQFGPGGEIIRASSNSNNLPYHNGSSPNLPVGYYKVFKPGETLTVDFYFDSNDLRERIPVTVKVDPENAVKESNENNNSQNLVYTHEPPEKKEIKKADLIIESILSNGPYTRSGFFIAVRIKNIGSEKTSTIQTHYNILSITGSVENKSLWKTGTKSEKEFQISPGKTKEFKLWILPTIWEGRIAIEVTVDPDNHIEESSETNNTRTLTANIVMAKRSR